MARKISSDTVNFNLRIVGGDEIQDSITKIASDTHTLIDRNRELAIEMQKLEVQGKKETDAWKELQKIYKENAGTITKNKEIIRSLEKQLGISALTLNQLTKRAKELQGQLNNTSKSLNPQEYAKLQRELKAVKDRMGELRGLETPFQKLRKTATSVLSGFSAFELIKTAIKGVKQVIGDTITATGDLADRWEIATASMKAGYESFTRTIATGDWGNLFSNMEKAITTAQEYQRVLQELEERNRSYALSEAEVKTEMEELRLVYTDVTKTRQERIAALQEYNKKVVELGEKRKSIINQELNDEQGGYARVMENITKLDAQKIKSFYTEYENQKELREQAKKYLQDIEDFREAAGNSAYGRQVAAKEVNFLKMVTTKSVKEYAEILNGIGIATDEELDKFVELQRKLILVDAEVNNELVTSRKKESQLILQIDEEEYQKRLKALESAQAARVIALKEERLNGEKTEEEYSNALTKLELKNLKERLKFLKDNGRDTTEVEKQIADARIKAQSDAEKENANILAEREKHFAALKKVSDDYAKTQVEQDEAELLAIKQKYAAAAETSKAAHDKQLIDDATFAQEQAELQAMLDGELEAKRREQAAKAAEEAAKLQEQYTRERNRILKEMGMQSLEELKSEELKELQKLLDAKLLTEEEYREALKKLDEKYEKAAEEKSKEALDKFLEETSEKVAKAQAAISTISNFVGALQANEDAETDLWREQQLAKETEDYNQKMALAEGNAEAQQKIQEDFAAEKERIDHDAAQKKLDTEKKFADANFAVQVAQAIAGGAMAVIQCFAQLGPIAGAIAAVITAATVGLQIATLNKQRKAIKATTLETSSSAPASDNSSIEAPKVNTQRTITPEGVDPSTIVKGYAVGGFTGSGGVNEPAGIVHRGEYVVPQVVMREPAALTYVGALEKIRVAKGLSRSPSARGYADGGYVQSGDAARQPLPPRLLALMEKTEQTLAATQHTLAEIQEKGVYANIGITELEAQRQRLENARKMART
jgi:hypothetical protein